MTSREYRKWWRSGAYKDEALIEAKYADHPRLYIGYGSNLNIPQMMGRCATAEKLRAVNLLGYELVFTDVLTVEPCPGSKVPCGLWRVKPMDIDALDTYEGYPHLYKKVYATINLEGADELAFMYVLDIEYELSLPCSYYLRTCLIGYRQWGLNEDVLRIAEAEAENAEREQDVTPMQCAFCDEVFPGSMLTYTRNYGWMCWDCYKIMFYTKDNDVYKYSTEGTTRTSLLYDDMHPDWETCDPSELDWTPGGNYRPVDDLGSNRYDNYGGGWS